MNKVKKTRRGFAGDDVTDNRDYQEEVVPEKDESYIVEDTDSPHETEQESEIITDDHQVVIDEESGDEEDFVAESEDGDAETIDEDGVGREGRRGSKKSRKGEDEESDEDEDEDEKEREGRRGVKRTRKGDSVLGSEVADLVMNEAGDTEKVELPEPDEDKREGRRGAVYGGKSPEHQASIQAAVSVAMRNRRL